jgi:hypothetical protein
MKKIISMLTIVLAAGLISNANAADHILLIKAEGKAADVRATLSKTFGTALKMQLRSTSEYVVIENTYSLAEAEKQLAGVMAGASVREVNAAEFSKLKGNQVRGK